MKRKAIERLIPIPTDKKGLVATVQELEDTLILNIYHDKKLQSRYCVNVKKCEYETLDCKSGEWKQRKLATAIGLDPLYHGSYEVDERLMFDSQEEKKLVLERTKEEGGSWRQTVGSRIENIESQFNRDRYERKEYNRFIRL